MSINSDKDPALKLIRMLNRDNLKKFDDATRAQVKMATKGNPIARHKAIAALIKDGHGTVAEQQAAEATPSTPVVGEHLAKFREMRDSGRRIEAAAFRRMNANKIATEERALIPAPPPPAPSAVKEMPMRLDSTIILDNQMSRLK